MQPGVERIMKKERKTLYILLVLLLLIISATILLAMRLDKSPDMIQSGEENIVVIVSKHDLQKVLNNAAELLSSNELYQAEQLLNNAIKQHPTNNDLWLLLGTVYFRQEKFDMAENAFRHIIRHTPDSVAGFNNLSTTLVKLKRYNEAKAAIGNALLLAPNNGGILLNAASLYALLKEDNQALTFLKRALDNGIQPEEVSGYIELVRLLERPDFMNYYNRKRSEQKNK